MRVQLPVESLSSFAGIRKVFAGAIGNLSATVLSSHLADCKFLAALAIDIMDRNLYERANDCRWWALDGTLRGQLSNEGSRVSSEAVEKLIGYINSLYTVYSNILVFDANGVVLAVSNPEYDHLAGQTLSDTWVAECLALRDSQAYAVSQFVPSALYAGQPTYIYLAPIFSADDRGVAGGIAIVFDSTPQFAAILDDALPRMAYGEAVSGSFALFVDEAGKIIAASTNAAASFPAGSSLPASLQVTIPATESNAQLMVLDEQVMAVGISPSQGYREFKGADDAYRNP